MSTISIYPMTRIEADGKIVLWLGEDDIIEKAHFYPFMPVRGFERMLVGKSLQFLPVAAMRICGVCHVTHGIAAIEAAEHALHLEPPRDGALLREIAGLGNRLQSHAMHMLFLLNDFFGENREIMKMVFKMLELGSEIVKISGHTPIHPSNVCVGGMLKNISDKGKTEIEKCAKDYISIITEFESLLKEKLESLLNENRIPESLGNVDLPLLTTGPYYGDREKIELLDLNVVPPDKYYDSPDIVEECGSAIAYYRNSITETGPTARMKTYFNFHSKLPLSVNIAYIEDAIKGCERILEICEELNVRGKTRNFAQPEAGKGIGVHEAPRGTNIHVLSLRKDGIITDYRIIVPTMFNIPVIDTALIGAPASFAEIIVRSYDPCLSCATHSIKLEKRRL
ncbi:MAG: coenzyme F420 hydrogenase subunit alpha [Euryarchaeota archaeon]|nr:coenzyme F420 hydrogenase subunit alpha [Euryarchaeota archaeon]